MTDIDRKIAGPLSDKLPTADDDWGPVALTPSAEVRIRLRVDPDAREEVVAAIDGLGGVVGSSFGKTIHARLQARHVLRLAEHDAVTVINEEIGYQAFDSHTVSEGVEISTVDEIHADGIDGTGVTVAIIDFYFDPDNPKYGDNVVATIGSDDGFISDDTLHGTGCAEVVSDMAPEVDLVLASIEGGESIIEIIDEIESQEPETDVVTMSLGSPPIDRLDGEDDESLRFAAFTDPGRLATISAGNEADGNTWHGAYADSNGNGLMEFDDSGTEYLEVENPTTGSYIIANWDDWDADDQEYVLRVYADEAKTDLLDEGGPTTEPWEVVQFSSTPPSSAYVEIETVDADGDQEFDIWIWDGDPSMQFPEHTRERSMSLPSTAADPDTLAVAAVQATDIGFEESAEDLKTYSSQGPTRDGRQGIDVAAPSRVSQTDNGYGSLEDSPSNGFNGTSAAAPHVGGAAAALFELDDVTNEEIREALRSTGREIADDDVSGTGNTKIGDGYIDVEAALSAIESDGPAITVDDQTIAPDGTAELSVSAQQVTQITIEKLWTDWELVAEDPDGGSSESTIETAGTYTIDWDDVVDDTSPSITVQLPNPPYVGGVYEVTATGTDGETSEIDTAIVEME